MTVDSYQKLNGPFFPLRIMFNELVFFLQVFIKRINDIAD